MGWILSKLFLCLQGFQTVLSYRTAQQPYFPPSGPPNKRQKNLTTYRAHIWSSPRMRKELTSYNIKKTEASLRYFISITADPKYQFIQVGLLPGKFICWLRKKKKQSLLQTLMLLADTAVQPSLGSHFLLICNKHKSFLRWKHQRDREEKQGDTSTPHSFWPPIL